MRVLAPVLALLGIAAVVVGTVVLDFVKDEDFSFFEGATRADIVTVAACGLGALGVIVGALARRPALAVAGIALPLLAIGLLAPWEAESDDLEDFGLGLWVTLGGALLVTVAGILAALWAARARRVAPAPGAGRLAGAPGPSPGHDFAARGPVGGAAASGPAGRPAPGPAAAPVPSPVPTPTPAPGPAAAPSPAPAGPAPGGHAGSPADGPTTVQPADTPTTVGRVPGGATTGSGDDRGGALGGHGGGAAGGSGGPAPGWYPDPTQAARLRFWDGSSWTGRTSD